MKTEKGFALVLTMLFAVMALAFTGALMFMTIQGTKVSGLTQRYATALDAGKGQSDVMMNLALNTPSKTAPDSGNPQMPNCLAAKLAYATIGNSVGDTAVGGYSNAWSTSCVAFTRTGDCVGVTTTCSGAKDNVTGTNAKDCPDVVAQLGDYCTYSKIIDVKYADDGTGSTGYQFLYYSMEIRTERISNPSENSQISFLYRVQQ
ncbi:MAG: hypothetical protein HQK88_08270 [Nitrospirae bacterium]|nr:hypothetical protein [Nitrospirota bacterium]MBF0519210.1 hypothetical protein [Nitrospirota bacterium]MBF0534881.1 hypothetical protein [Nitrospirota bacterium]MBF0616796.1 hypothetical protein [Nitrospirota bacterium]